MVHLNYSTLPLVVGEQPQTICEWCTWFCANKALFTQADNRAELSCPLEFADLWCKSSDFLNTSSFLPNKALMIGGFVPPAGASL